MACPFPGMDPYLEGSAYWQGFHNSLMTYVRDALQPRLPDNYVATLEVRIYVDPGSADDPLVQRVPDVELLRTGPGARRGEPEGARQRQPELRGYWIEDAPAELRESFVDIRTAPGEELVTSIELLSPANKRPGVGREAYLKKQSEVIHGEANLVEIDLLREGTHTVAVRRDLLAPIPRYDYLLCVFRAARPWGYQVIPWSVREALPLTPVPLKSEDGELELDLQALFTQAHQNGAFHRLLRYEGEPVPPFRQEDLGWARELLERDGQPVSEGA
jgi:hypothetical protein